MCVRINATFELRIGNRTPKIEHTNWIIATTLGTQLSEHTVIKALDRRRPYTEQCDNYKCEGICSYPAVNLVVATELWEHQNKFYKIIFSKSISPNFVQPIS